MSASLIYVTRETFDRVCLERDKLKEERKAAIRQARSLCREFGLANDWPDNLHLADIIEKRIYNPLVDIVRERKK